MGPPFLAGQLDSRTVDVRLHDEHSGGHLEDPRLLGWPDLLVLTGLTNALDRMLHLTAYARTCNPRVAVAAGGPAVRAFPRFAASVFDYACMGDVEELCDVADEALGPGHSSADPLPRYDLASWMGAFGHVESSRYCNYRCAFCSLTGEGGRYRAYALDDVRRQIEAIGPSRYLVFIDNNLYGRRDAEFAELVELLRELKARGRLWGWAGLVTSDFFRVPENLERARASGCVGLYCGVESFDRATLLSFHKGHNAVGSSAKLIADSLEAGILLVYGLVLDPAHRRLSEIRAEIDYTLGEPRIALPSMYTLTIPYPGTPLFERLRGEGRLLPGTLVRDLDGKTLCVRPLDPLEETARFVRDLQTMRGRRAAVLGHAVGFARRYRRSLSPLQLAAAAGRALELLRPGGARARTHVAGTEPLDGAYEPAFPVDERWRHLFRPTRLVDERGAIAPELAPDLEASPAPGDAGGDEPRSRRPQRALSSVVLPGARDALGRTEPHV